ncbi:helix-turn-helix domain-containing protein [Niabella sp. W65]|nr:helix-turn-helix domain-containing protein [Niabella sp. W65]MCH7368611.1 helix-turn-helix domain-containing protein [Niabella sp. W65]ULT44200.1 helix-turn-helix domain-containing protein [Niabella sp. I65]
MADLINKALETRSTPKELDKFLSPIEVAEMFDVSLPTIHAWSNAGILRRLKIGTRTYYKQSEVMKAVKPVSDTN